jgi:DNA-binding transcriptional LysR family regulator
LAYAWLPLHLVADALASGRLQRLPLSSGGSRRVTLYVVVVRPELMGPAARAAVEAFGRMQPTVEQAAS